MLSGLGVVHIVYGECVVQLQKVAVLVAPGLGFSLTHPFAAARCGAAGTCGADGAGTLVVDVDQKFAQEVGFGLFTELIDYGDGRREGIYRCGEALGSEVAQCALFPQRSHAGHSACLAVVLDHVGTLADPKIRDRDSCT